ncbi:MAG: FadR/GntR family transcriptional regulator [Acidimicrobiales bacterium]|jgi:GntR family transcriptional repressor for pyruvate dehydrogenase complex
MKNRDTTDGLIPQLSLLSGREPLSSEIAKGLIEYLVSGVLLPGDRLPSERELSSALGVGRSVVREALKLLTLLGIIEVRQGDGSYLRATSSELLPKVVEWGLLLGEPRTEELIEARCIIEAALASLAAKRRSDRDLLDLRGLLNGMKVATTAKEFIEADTEFHLRLATAARNNVLEGVLLNIRSLIHVWITRVTTEASSTTPSYKEHAPIMEAVESQDPEAAARAMEDHLNSAAAKLQRILEAERDAEDHAVSSRRRSPRRGSAASHTS